MKKTYDPALRQSELGQRLYYYWKVVRQKPHPPEWDFFPNFYEWALSGGFEPGAKLCLLNAKQPYSTDNCVWEVKNDEDAYNKARAAKWNATVNRIRKHFGMEPLEGTSYDGI